MLGRMGGRLVGWLAAMLVVLVVAPVGCGSTSSDDSGDEPAGERDAAVASSPPPPEPDLIEVSDVTGEDGQDAVDTLEAEGFTVDFTEDSGRDPAGCEVLSQDLEGEAEAEAEVLLELDCRQVDWENQDGEDWELFSTAYDSGFEAGCADVFFEYGDRALYTDDGDEVTDLDCPSADVFSADVPGDVPDDPEVEGDVLGRSDGCEALFEDVAFYGSLHSSDDTEVDFTVCP